MGMSWDRLNKQKVIILVPHRGESDYRQWRDWFLTGLQMPPGTSYLEMRGLSLTTQRTKLVQEALARPIEYLFFLDDDILGPPDLLTTLLSYALPIASGLYWAKKRVEERGLAAWINVNNNGYLSIEPKQDGRLVQVDVTGLGCSLIHRSVFERTTFPWFEWPPEGPSEDFWFFEKVSRELGIKPMVDMELRCDHIGLFRLTGDGTFTTLEK
ncbi:hypothetical protein LCGC14_0263480 [marine sediment metagenome]|uniref:Glycosyltransferase 2-like domain-containing protein n=1 Tax=marine sediment metagenome TaxID=412755 RepID=A0A0F9X666_9ZZZZ